MKPPGRPDSRSPTTSSGTSARGGLSPGVTRGLGWLLIAVWLIGVGAFGLWQLLTSPENLLPKLLVVGSAGGFALLFLSILFDRLRDMKTDRYRRVRK